MRLKRNLERGLDQWDGVGIDPSELRYSSDSRKNILLACSKCDCEDYYGVELFGPYPICYNCGNEFSEDKIKKATGWEW